MKIVTRAPVWLVLCLGFIATNLAQSQQLPPFSYYASTTNLTGATLKSALHNAIRSHDVFNYLSSGNKAAVAVLDRDPTNSANVILIYSGYSIPATSSTWNKEHIWPQSYGSDSDPQRGDLFNLRACDSGVNSSRNNKYYDVTTGAPGYHADAPQSVYDGDSWEPRDGDKGYVARATFYMTTCYNGTGGDINLELSDTPNAGLHAFAKLSTLLDWNRRFPPTLWEQTRNGVNYQTYQHNRNPFIDNPDFADMVFLGVDGFAAWRGTHFATAELSNATVSAAAADPDGDGLPNLAEYTFGHDPHVADGNAIQSLTLQTISETNYFYVTHHRHHYLSGMSLTYQTSTNLSAWNDATAELVTNTQIDAQKDLVTVRFPANGQSGFVRFKLHRLTDGPLIVEDGLTLLSESCAPANGVIDPDETVTLGLSLKNVGTADTSNLVVTLLSTGGVTSPSGSQNYGVVHADGASVAQSFTFIATGSCRGNITATLQLQDGLADLGVLTFIFPLGQPVNSLDESFDSIAAPSLPAGWTTAASGAQSNWATSTTQADSPPNAAFSADPGDVGVNELVTPSFFINSALAQLTFQQNYSLTASATNSSVGYDGGVLEIKIGGGSFQDILDAGGSFISGGYNTTLSSDYSNPLAGRQAWSGNSSGFLTTTVNLPVAAANQNVQLRWRCGAGSTPTEFEVVEPSSFTGTLTAWDTSTLPGGANNYGPSPFTATITGSNVTVGGLTRGSGVTTSGTAAGRAWGGNGWTDGNAADAITNNRFATFTVQANPGSSMTFSNITKFDYRRSATGPSNGRLQYQVGPADSFHDITDVSYSSASSSGASIGSIDLSGISALQNVAGGTVVTFRIVNWGGTSPAGTWYIFDKDGNTAADFEVQGTVTTGGVGGGWHIDSVLVEDAICCNP